MKPERRKIKRAARASRHAKSRRGAARFITRAEALARVRERVARRVFNRRFRGVPVVDVEKAVLNIYHAPIKNAWVVYERQPDYGMRPSVVSVICKRTGKVLYAGSACDEG